MRVARCLSLALLLGALFASTAFAANTSETSASLSPGSASHPWSFELNATLLGNYNENTYELSKPGFNGNSTDFGLDLAARRDLTATISTGLRLSFYAAIANATERYAGISTQNTRGAYVFPTTWTARYQPVRFLNQSFFRPWFEGEAGLSFIEIYPIGRRTTTFVRPTARASLGFDLQPLPSDRIFVSVRASYLAVSDFSNYQFGLGSGVRF
jgi:hypothetical protein